MIKMEDCEVDEDDRPLFPPKIKRTEVGLNWRKWARGRRGWGGGGRGSRENCKAKS